MQPIFSGALKLLSKCTLQIRINCYYMHSLKFIRQISEKGHYGKQISASTILYHFQLN